MVRRLHASLLGVLLPVVALVRLYFDQQHVGEYAVQHTTSLSGLDVLNTSNLGQTEPGTPGTEKVNKEPLLAHHHNVSSVASETIDMFDLDPSKPALCGFIKCYFRSKSDSQVGYVVAPTSKKTKGRLKSLTAAWNLAEQLRREYNTTHFLLAPPANAHVTNELYSRLNSNLFNERTQKVNKKLTRFRKSSTVVVQKVRPAPKERIMIGCARPKLRVLNKQINKFITKVDDKASFARRFKESFTQVRKLLVHEPCLIIDFQIFVDTFGNIYHLDIDRCFNAKTTKKKNVKLKNSHCYKHSLDKIEQTVYQALKRSKR